MTEKRFIVYDDGFSKHIEDTYYTEDKHEHNLYDIWEMCHKLNELSEKEEQLLSEIDDFQELLSEKDNICYSRVINVIDDKLVFLYGAKGDLINEDSYRLRQISFAINLLNELKKELKGDVE